MRSVLSAALLLPLLSSPAYADLFFSEYVEGSSFNKAIEVYNPGPGAVDLSSYTVEQYSNGGRTTSADIGLSGTLAAGQVYVLAHTQAAAAVIKRANQTHASLGFNGDDTLLLKKAGTVIDRFGQVGFRPDQAWVSGGISTLDRTLRRKLTVAQGDTAYETAFDPAVEWDGFAKDDFTGLGVYSGTVPDEPETPAVVAQCGATALPIAEVQGNTATSPQVGKRVGVEAIVTGNYLGTNGFGGFFLQTADGERKNLANTSEGLFVYAPNLAAGAVKAGARVHVVGTVEEAFGQTQLKLESNLAECAPNGQATAQGVTLPLAAHAEFADYEGMLVTFRQPLVVNEVYELGRYGSVVLGSSLLQVPTHTAAPGAAAQAVMAQNARSRIILDDGLNNQNPDPVAYPQGGLSAANTLRRGYTTQSATGVMEKRFSEWRIQPIPGAAVPTFVADGNPRPQAPVRSAGSDTRVAAFNVLNYFNGDSTGSDEGFKDPNNRGASDQAEFVRQHDKIVAAIDGMDADIVGLMEIENDGYGSRSAIRTLTQGLKGDWQFVDPGVDRLGTDAIAVALIYRADKVKPVGQAATLEIDDKNRQPLAQTFEPLAGGKPVTVVVNHLKSKGCSGATGIDADQGDGQSCWAPTRSRAAGLINDWLATAPTQVADSATLIIGDLNAYAMENPILRFEQAGYADLQRKAHGAAAYTYVFEGESGYLDHALGNAAAQARTRGVQSWHINADEPIALEYTVDFKSEGQKASFYAADAYRSSDHDPVIVDLALVDAPVVTPPVDGGTGGNDGGNAGGDEGSGGGGGALAWLPLALLGWLAARGVRGSSLGRRRVG